MKITDIRLRLGRGSEEGGKLKAYVDITFDESFVVHGLKIIEGQNGLFVAMPSRRMPNGEFKDIAHPITPELRSELTRVILESYEKEPNKYKLNSEFTILITYFNAYNGKIELFQNRKKYNFLWIYIKKFSIFEITLFYLISS